MKSQNGTGPARTFSQRQIRLSLRHVVALSVVTIITVLVTVNRHHLEGLAACGYLGVFGLCFLSNVTVLLPAPSLAVVFTFGSVYAPLWVGIVGALGTTLGELTGYLAGYGSRPLVEHSKWSERIHGPMQRNSFQVIFLMALAPLPLFDVAGIVAGSVGVSARRFLAPCLAGKLIKMLAFSYAGAGVLPWLAPIISR